MAESFVSTLKAELVSRLEFPSRQAARTAISSTWRPSQHTPAAFVVKLQESRRL